MKIRNAVSELFQISAPVPTSFASIPLLNNQNATFYYFIDHRGDGDIDDFWALFSSALAYTSSPMADNRAVLSRYFDIVEKLRGWLQSDESSLKDFKELSFEAWRYSEEINEEEQAASE